MTGKEKELNSQKKVSDYLEICSLISNTIPSITLAGKGSEEGEGEDADEPGDTDSNDEED